MSKKISTYSISSILSDFLHQDSNSSTYQFKKSPEVMNELLESVLERVGGKSSIPTFGSDSVSLVLNGELSGIFIHKEKLVFITQNGTFNKSAGASNISALDSYVKMAEHRFNGQYPGKYQLLSNEFYVVDGQYHLQTSKSEVWRKFNLFNQLNQIHMGNDESYICSLLKAAEGLSDKETEAFISEHIKQQLSFETKFPFRCDPKLLKRLTTCLSIMNMEDKQCAYIDLHSYATEFVKDFILLRENPPLHDAIQIESGNNPKLLSVIGLGNATQLNEYITAIQNLLDAKLINDPSFATDLHLTIGGKGTLDRIKEHVEKSVHVELHDDLNEYSNQPSM